LNVIWLDKAREDVLEIVNYILLDDPYAAMRVRDRLHEAVAVLAK